MKNEYKNIITSRWVRFFSFLVIVYFSQLYPFYHLHHFHDQDSLEFEISAHPAEVDVDHSSDHHHDEDSTHNNDHHHTYNKQIDWHIIRIQNPRTLTLENQYYFSSFSIFLTTNNPVLSVGYQDLQYRDDPYHSSSIIRGPPLLG